MDYINSVDHVLEVSCGKFQEMFKAPCKLPPTDRHSTSWWSIKDKHWMRIAGSPDSLFSATGIHVLLVTADQKQSQWSALQYVVDQEVGLGLMSVFRQDLYHIS
jgi:hypothetical protein